MSHLMIGVIGLVVFLMLVGIGVPMGFAGFLIGLGGIATMVGASASLNLIVNGYYFSVSSEALSVLPLFIIMGGFAVASGATRDGFEASRRWVGHLPGGLIATTSITGALFGAMCGSSMASVATLARITNPEIKKAGYDPGIMAAAVSSIGGLASMIPPSSLMVIYGMLTEASIRKLLVAGLIPGIINAILFIVLAIIMGKRFSKKLPPLPKATWKERFAGLQGIWPIIVIAGTLIISIYTGIATATEAGAIGVLASLGVALVRRTPLKALKDETIAAAVSTCKVLLIIAGMMFFARFMALSGLVNEFQSWINGLGLSGPVYLLAIMVMYLILGCFLDTIGMLTLTLPFVFPVIVGFGYDPVWFGVIIVLVSEIGLITPPIGLNVFVAAGAMPEVPLSTIFRNVVPFFFTYLIVLALLILVPQISLFLPSRM